MTRNTDRDRDAARHHLTQLSSTLGALGQALGAVEPSLRADLARFRYLVRRPQPTQAEVTEALSTFSRLLGALQEHSHVILLASNRVRTSVATGKRQP